MIQTRTVALPHRIELNCRVCGEPGRPVLMFLHGFPEGAFVWDGLLEHFAQPAHGGYRCIAPNLRGYGGSSAPTDTSAYRAKHLVEDLRALIAIETQDASRPGRLAGLVAHDWGGALAWNLAALHPDLMERLVIVNAPHPGTFWRDLHHSPAQQAASAYMNFLVRPDAATLLTENDYRRLWAFFTAPGGSGAPDWLTEDVRQRYREVWGRGLDGPLNYYRASPLRPPTASDAYPVTELPRALLDVRVPTMVLWGMDDPALLPGLLDGLDDYVADLRVEPLAGVSHWLLHEAPDAVRDRIAYYLSVSEGRDTQGIAVLPPRGAL